jgi:hypothetical protein
VIPVCRVGDTGVGICYAHPVPTPYVTTFVEGGAVGVTADGLDVCIVGAIGMATCGHPTVALTGSDIAVANDLGLHRVGDTGANFGPYTAMTGSDLVQSE